MHKQVYVEMLLVNETDSEFLLLALKLFDLLLELIENQG